METCESKKDTYQSLADLINPTDSASTSYSIQDHTFVQALMNTQPFGQKPSRKSLFTSHLLQADNQLISKPISKGWPDWMPIVLILSLTLLIILRNLYPKHLKILLLAPFSGRSMGQLTRDSDNLSGGIRLLLVINYLIITSLTLYIGITHFITIPSQWSFLQGFGVFVTLMFTLTGWFVLKNGIAKFIGHLFKEYSVGSRYQMTLLLMSIIMGFILLPLIFALLYLPAAWFEESAIIGLSIIIILLLIKYLKLIVIGAEFRWYALVYLFLYLCTLEILPVFMLIKAIAKLDPA